MVQCECVISPTILSLYAKNKKEMRFGYHSMAIVLLRFNFEASPQI